MKLKAILTSTLISLSLIFLFACKKPQLDSPWIVDTAIDLWVRDSTGKNLLDSTTTHFYKESEIRIYYLENGIKQEVYTPAWGAPRHFSITENPSNGEYFFHLFPNEGIRSPDQDGRRDENTTTYIQWNESKTDTLVCTITRVKSITVCSKVYFNSVLKFDEQTAKSQFWDSAIVYRFFEVRH
jgi:hypothetical protein